MHESVDKSTESGLEMPLKKPHIKEHGFVASYHLGQLMTEARNLLLAQSS
jgi:hypothetical protein